jgi:hypothetical protein
MIEVVFFYFLFEMKRSLLLDAIRENTYVHCAVAQRRRN